MRSDLVKIKFFFPKISHNTKNKREFVELLMKAMKKDRGIRYAGYLKEKDLFNDLLRHIGDGNTALYKSISIKQKQAIKRAIHAAVKKCHNTLPHPDLPVFAFVYPWFPEAENRVLFGGTMALATHYTMHLFVDLRAYTQTSLKQTIAHEWSHLVFYRHHLERRYTLRAHMIMEGLAEVFREEIMDGKPSPWALALTRKEAQKQFAKLKQKLDTKSMRIYKELFFGNKKYKRWTGYSIGYRLVKKFRKKYPKLSWQEIIKTKPEYIEAVAKKWA